MVKLKGVVIMANVYCDSEYCEPISKESANVDSSDTVFSDTVFSNIVFSNTVLFGGIALMLIVFTAIVWYENSIGIYIDATSLN